MRVATGQFRTGKDTDRVLRELLALIDQAAAGGAVLVHFQECCNYPTSYDGREHAWREAITIPGPMFDAIAARARRHRIYVSFNAAVKGEYPAAYMVNHLVGPDGRWIGGNPKQVLMWIEREAFSPSTQESQVFDTPIGRIGMLSCMDGLVPETARVLAVKGADIILNALCSNGVDEAHVHIPARAAENGVFMIAANRIGDMVDGEDLERLKRESGMDREKLEGAGESQVVAPDGSILARCSRSGYELVFADIDLAQSERRERLANRRPECYGLLAVPNEQLPALLAGRAEAGRLHVTTLPAGRGGALAGTLETVAGAVAGLPRGLVVLPECFAWPLPPAAGTIGSEGPEAQRALEALARRLGTWIAAGIPQLTPRGLANRAVLVGPDGLVGEYLQVHRDAALGTEPAGDDFPVFDLPFGRVGLLLGEDLRFPEAARILARKGVDLVACPATWRTSWQSRLMLTERSAENRIAIAVAARPDSPLADGCIVTSTAAGFPFPTTGEVNIPERWSAASPLAPLTVELDLATNRDKRLMFSTNVIMDTQPRLYGALTRRSTP
ncbi:MAG: carbon-nitrogen hydrolase family protein [Steroidobacteraceae bacterium]